ncbi:acetylglutamate kinase [Savagea serpentis]|uniref:acetylglutamate kinase n=1 Tax=Savagea serpentis TaxID=2785297 RepID=UPI001BC8E5D3|nr:acetylglutamate kinase [Savagea serpentis]
MTTCKSTLHTERDTIVLKLGGSMLSELNDSFFTKLKEMHQHSNIVITHGGGPNISRALEEANIPYETVNGLRVTTKKAAKIVRNTLNGEVNAPLVHRLTKAGLEAVGLSGYDNQLFVCTYLDEATYGEVGVVQEVHKAWLEKLFALNVIPVISCVGCNEQGEPLNINGDDAATAVAVSLQADQMIFVTDVQGLLVDGELIESTTECEINRWIEDGTIYGGMIPKVKGALATMKEGVASVQITNETLQGTTIVDDIKENVQ